MIIIDPDKNGASIYSEMFYSRINGTVEEVCENILSRICSGKHINGNPRQIRSIGIVFGGIGTAYIDFFRERGIDIYEIVPKSIDTMLPIIDKSQKEIYKKELLQNGYSDLEADWWSEKLLQDEVVLSSHTTNDNNSMNRSV